MGRELGCLTFSLACVDLNACGCVWWATQAVWRVCTLRSAIKISETWGYDIPMSQCIGI